MSNYINTPAPVIDSGQHLAHLNRAVRWLIDNHAFQTELGGLAEDPEDDPSRSVLGILMPDSEELQRVVNDLVQYSMVVFPDLASSKGRSAFHLMPGANHGWSGKDSGEVDIYLIDLNLPLRKRTQAQRAAHYRSNKRAAWIEQKAEAWFASTMKMLRDASIRKEPK